MMATPLSLALDTVQDLAHTAILFYLIYSIRLYLTARLDKFGPEQLLEPKADAAAEAAAEARQGWRVRDILSAAGGRS